MLDLSLGAVLDHSLGAVQPSQSVADPYSCPSAAAIVVLERLLATCPVRCGAPRVLVASRLSAAAPHHVS